MKRAKHLTRRERGTHVEATPYASRPGTLNRHWRRAIESIVRTARKPDHAEIALARKLGDEVMMRPFAAHLLIQRTAAIAAEKEKRESLYHRMLEHFGRDSEAMLALGIDPASGEIAGADRVREASRG